MPCCIGLCCNACRSESCVRYTSDVQSSVFGHVKRLHTDIRTDNHNHQNNNKFITVATAAAEAEASVATTTMTCEHALSYAFPISWISCPSIERITYGYVVRFRTNTWFLERCNVLRWLCYFSFFLSFFLSLFFRRCRLYVNTNRTYRVINLYYLKFGRRLCFANINWILYDVRSSCSLGSFISFSHLAQYLFTAFVMTRQYLNPFAWCEKSDIFQHCQYLIWFIWQLLTSLLVIFHVYTFCLQRWYSRNKWNMICAFFAKRVRVFGKKFRIFITEKRWQQIMDLFLVVRPRHVKSSPKSSIVTVQSGQKFIPSNLDLSAYHSATKGKHCACVFTHAKYLPMNLNNVWHGFATVSTAHTLNINGFHLITSTVLSFVRSVCSVFINKCKT